MPASFPAEHANLDVLGRYSFRASVPGAGGLDACRESLTAGPDVTEDAWVDVADRVPSDL